MADTLPPPDVAWTRSDTASTARVGHMRLFVAFRPHDGWLAWVKRHDGGLVHKSSHTDRSVAENTAARVGQRESPVMP